MDQDSRPPSTLDLIGTTPLRDIVRGRLTGRLDIPSALSDLDLPQDLPSHMAASAARARIPALHRPAIARHFGELARRRLDAGVSPPVVLSEHESARGTAKRMRAAHDQLFGVSPIRRIR